MAVINTAINAIRRKKSMYAAALMKNAPEDTTSACAASQDKDVRGLNICAIMLRVQPPHMRLKKERSVMTTMTTALSNMTGANAEQTGMLTIPVHSCSIAAATSYAMMTSSHAKRHSATATAE